VGDKATDFSLQNAKGKKTNLYTNLTEGPVVLTWYRGGWYPYCNITLNQLQKDLTKFSALGARIMALTPELPDSSINTAQKNALKFDVLSDLGNKVAEQYGVVYTLTPDVATRYQEGFGLHEYNGNKSNKLPLAVTYVIGTDGIIKYAFLHADYRKRAEPSVLLEVLKVLK
jgi:peroxiredoxin